MYSLKRIFFAIITLYLAIVLLYCLITIVGNDQIYLKGIDLAKLQIKEYSEEYYELLNNRKQLLGVNGTLLHQILLYLRNITPFIPKTVLVDAFFNEKGEMTGKEIRTFFYLGVVIENKSATTGQLVSSVISKRMVSSLKIGSISTFISLIIGIPIGIYSALNKENIKDNIITWFCLILFALPALIVVRLFYQLSLSAGGSIIVNDSSSIYSWMFPITILVLLTTPGIIFETRRYVVTEMNADYTKFALSKGMTNSRVFFVHVFRVSGIAIIRSIPAAFIGNLFGSSLIVEKSWNIPGMSNLTVNSINGPDLFTLLGIVLISAFISILVSLISDLLIVLLDPRVKLIQRKG